VKSDFQRPNFRDGKGNTRPRLDPKNSYESKHLKQTDRRSEWREGSPKDYNPRRRETSEIHDRSHKSRRESRTNKDSRTRLREIDDRRDGFFKRRTSDVNKDSVTRLREIDDRTERAYKTRRIPDSNKDARATFREIEDRPDRSYKTRRTSDFTPNSARSSREAVERDQSFNQDNGPYHISRSNATSQFIFGRNAVIAALSAKRRRFFVLYRMNEKESVRSAKSKDDSDSSGDKVALLAEAAGVRIVQVDKSWTRAFQRVSGDSPHNVSSS
jgi:hypothetical protein